MTTGSKNQHFRFDFLQVTAAPVSPKSTFSGKRGEKQHRSATITFGAEQNGGVEGDAFSQGGGGRENPRGND